MINKLFYFFTAAFIILNYSFSSGIDYVYEPGEELHYEVSYMGIKLGKLLIKSERDTIYKGQNAYKIKAWMDTYSGIPFLSLHAFYESFTDKSLTYSYLFNGYTQLEDKSWELHRIMPDYKTQKIKTEKWVKKKLIEEHNMKSSKKWSDGVTLVYLCRKYINLKRQINIPTVMGNDTAITKLNFRGLTQNIDIGAVKYPVRSVYMNGKAGWKGVYGVTGDFKAWFSDDAGRVPLKAEMELYLGSVAIELVKWKKKSWQPPKAN